MAGSVMDFWFEFDNFFNPSFGEVGDGVLEAYAGIGGPPGPKVSWQAHRQGGTYPDGFRDAMVPRKDALMFLADAQLVIFDRHFGGDHDAEQTAFEEFGQGLHFDDRRPPRDKVHKMDINDGEAAVAYHWWHAFMRAVVAVGADEPRWLGLNRNLGLAWAIQNEARPREDNPNNPPLPQERLEALRGAWLPMGVEELDDAFDHELAPAL